MTLADEDTNSILTDYVNRAIEGNEAMQLLLVANYYWKQCSLLANFESNASDAS